MEKYEERVLTSIYKRLVTGHDPKPIAEEILSLVKESKERLNEQTESPLD